MRSLIFFALFLGLAAAQQCGKPAVNPSRDYFLDKIVGGTIAVKNSLPWQIHLAHKGGWFGSTQFVCGGTIISAKWVLTAAHCVYGKSAGDLVVRVGQFDSSLQESSAKNYNVKRLIRHASYNPNNMQNDIALMEIDGSIAFSDAVKAACLPPASHDCSSGSEAVASGWGETSANGRESIAARYPWQEDRAISTKLRKVAVKCVSRSVCNQADYYGGIIANDMICAGSTGKDSCQGDSGGPLVQKNSSGNYEVIGVVSWGYGCGAVKKPGVYARVGYFRSWIQQNTQL